MIAYFDTSALIKLLIDESGHADVLRLWRRASRPASSLLVYVEGRAALSQAWRQRRLTDDQLRESVSIFEIIYERLSIVEIDPALIFRAGDLAQIHGLRGYDAVHLASAEKLHAPDLVLITSDVALARSAEAEGISVARIT